MEKQNEFNALVSMKLIGKMSTLSPEKQLLQAGFPAPQREKSSPGVLMELLCSDTEQRRKQKV